MAEFIMELEQWEWYATLTFARSVHPEIANKAFMRWIHAMNLELFGKNYRKRKNRGVRWIRGKEHQARNVIHYHCLMSGGVYKLRRLSWMDYWCDGFPVASETESGYRGYTQHFPGGNGYARIVPYDVRKGAGYYISKYLTKGGEIDFSITPFYNEVQSQVQLPF